MGLFGVVVLAQRRALGQVGRLLPDNSRCIKTLSSQSKVQHPPYLHDLIAQLLAHPLYLLPDSLYLRLLLLHLPHPRVDLVHRHRQQLQHKQQRVILLPLCLRHRVGHAALSVSLQLSFHHGLELLRVELSVLLAQLPSLRDDVVVVQRQVDWRRQRKLLQPCVQLVEVQPSAPVCVQHLVQLRDPSRQVHVVVERRDRHQQRVQHSRDPRRLRLQLPLLLQLPRLLLFLSRHRRDELVQQHRHHDVHQDDRRYDHVRDGEERYPPVQVPHLRVVRAHLVEQRPRYRACPRVSRHDLEHCEERRAERPEEVLVVVLEKVRPQDRIEARHQQQ
mmetsp:Transcript_9502/g.21573  ORF Transcript_9502/g.21573 Transcript_9502/m.21573 type:complete len:332 (+) Transcript_9502:588-1583(+)